MSKEKRIYNSEVAIPTSLQLQRTAPTAEKNPVQTERMAAKRQFFSPELISRLAERIKQL